MSGPRSISTYPGDQERALKLFFSQHLQKLFNHLVYKTVYRRSDFPVILSALLGYSEFGANSRSGGPSPKEYAEYCHRMLQEDIIGVTVKMASSVYTLSTRSAKNTLSDKVRGRKSCSCELVQKQRPYFR